MSGTSSSFPTRSGSSSSTISVRKEKKVSKEEKKVSKEEKKVSKEEKKVSKEETSLLLASANQQLKSLAEIIGVDPKKKKTLSIDRFMALKDKLNVPEDPALYEFFDLITSFAKCAPAVDFKYHDKDYRIKALTELVDSKAKKAETAVRQLAKAKRSITGFSALKNAATLQDKELKVFASNSERIIWETDTGHPLPLMIKDPNVSVSYEVKRGMVLSNLRNCLLNGEPHAVATASNMMPKVYYLNNDSLWYSGDQPALEAIERNTCIKECEHWGYLLSRAQPIDPEENEDAKPLVYYYVCKSKCSGTDIAYGYVGKAKTGLPITGELLSTDRWSGHCSEAAAIYNSMLKNPKAVVTQLPLLVDLMLADMYAHGRKDDSFLFVESVWDNEKDMSARENKVIEKVKLHKTLCGLNART
eukprot:TRINITY_DN653_c0_g1_i1.p1 TRINITY_DN653_c0_g1~~TRINITY_DN653_c0_g1_i1.p1  ORF type:complete len:416 (+),score=79.85 TRINITY_DN653_c0_g1_i1:92-1339(+)